MRRPLFRYANAPARPLPGFTLVELLVVIAIIGTLVSLLLPAVQSAREAARNNTCKNNIKQLVTAMTNYDTTQSELPGLINEIGNQGSSKAANGELSVGRRASWVVMLFPYMENGPLWDRWTQSWNNSAPITQIAAIDASFTPEIASMQCPSDPAETVGEPTTSYVGNAGWAFGDPSRPTGTLLEYAADGVFFDLNKKATGIPTTGWLNAVDNREGTPTLQMSLAYISSGDGTSKTMMISENLNAVNYTYSANDNSIPDAKQHFGFVWHRELPTSSGYPDNVYRINGGRDQSVATPTTMVDVNESLAYPSSNHPGGVNIAFCDGSVRYINERVTSRVYAQSMTTKYKRSNYYDVDDNRTPDRNLPQPSESDL
ncbi:hypothetical protein Pla108_08650 [Botrimarina colliarenosi]|uniref:DUF1559 domain-containing protein n=1 Tax=Botrimarina colliarenosi TaxID=2528001 RepID=A0A5C6ALK7_9BACT|nr:DUF1559 domain-containing protein [Botrimarina colliarenosi]TWT99921.1 hypothetical protein Pla108_08650 [Botrimarina colliarenosi]